MVTTPAMLWMNEENKRKVIQSYQRMAERGYRVAHSRVCQETFGKMTGQEWAWCRQVYLTCVKDKEVRCQA